MKKALLFLVILILLSYIVSAGFCGDGICGDNENNKISCGDYPFGLEQEIKSICWISSSPGGSCPVDCGSLYDLSPILFECYEPPTGELCSECGDFVCYDNEDEESCPEDCIDKERQFCGDGVCNEGIEDQDICKNPSKGPLPPESYCSISCYEDCGPLAINSGQAQKPARIPLELDENDAVNPIFLELDSCSGNNLGSDGSLVALGICLENVNSEGVTVSFRSHKKDTPLTNYNVEIKEVFIKYNTLYNYDANTAEKRDKYLFPTYNSIMNIQQDKGIVSLYIKKVILKIKRSDHGAAVR